MVGFKCFRAIPLFGMMNNASVRESDVIQRLEQVERKVDDAVNCMFDLVRLYSDTNGLEPGVKRPQSALRDATDGRPVGSANVAPSSDEVASRRPWQKAHCCWRGKRSTSVRDLWIKGVVDAMRGLWQASVLQGQVLVCLQRMREQVLSILSNERPPCHAQEFHVNVVP